MGNTPSIDYENKNFDYYRLKVNWNHTTKKDYSTTIMCSKCHYIKQYDHWNNRLVNIDINLHFDEHKKQIDTLSLGLNNVHSPISLLDSFLFKRIISSAQ